MVTRLISSVPLAAFVQNMGYGEKCPIPEVAAVSENVCSTPDNHRQLKGDEWTLGREAPLRAKFARWRDVWIGARKQSA